MLACPHCHSAVDLRKLPHEGLFKSYRLCPYCRGSFTVDADTKYRQALFILVALISLVFTICLYFDDSAWLLPSVTSYLCLAALIAWGNKKVYLVPYGK